MKIWIVAAISSLLVLPANAAQKTDPTKPAGVNTVNEKLKEINNPDRQNPGRVIESRDVPPKREPRPRD